MACPYICPYMNHTINPNIIFNHHNPMHMIRHYHEFVNADTAIMMWNILPCLVDHFSTFIQFHPAVYDSSQPIDPALGTKRYKIPSRQGIIVIIQAIIFSLPPHINLLLALQAVGSAGRACLKRATRRSVAGEKSSR